MIIMIIVIVMIIIIAAFGLPKISTVAPRSAVNNVDRPAAASVTCHSSYRCM